MVQNGAKFNRGLKRWELPPGSNPTARMGVQGENGGDSIPPLGQKEAALRKDAERKAKAKSEPENIVVIGKPLEQQRAEREAQRKKEKDEMFRQIPIGVRRALYDVVYWEYAASQGKPRWESGYSSSQQSKDDQALIDFTKKVPARASAKDKKADKEKRKIIQQYKKEMLPEAVAEFNRIHGIEER